MSVKKLVEIADFLDNKRKPLNGQERNGIKGDIPYYGANGVVDHINKYIFDEPLILLAEDGGHFGSKNRPIAYKIEGKSWVNNHAHVLKPKKGIDLDFLKWSLSFYDVTKYVTGSTRIKLTKSDAEKMEIDVPVLATQQKIAQILCEADKARQLRKQANALTDQFLQSTFLNMFGDPVNNPKGWETETISESGSKVQIGPFGTQLHVEDYVEGGIPLINPTHIQNSKIKEDNKFTITPEKFDELSNYHLVQGDIIMGRRGEMGRCALVTQREQGWLCGTGSLFIRPSKKLDSLYLLNVLTSKSFKETLEHEAKGVTMANLNKTIINNLLIPVPPKKLQQQFADIIADTEQLRQLQRAHEQELDQLFKGLLQKYFG